MALVSVAAQAGAVDEVPAWLYPSNSPALAVTATDASARIQLAGSSKSYTQDELTDLFTAPDWGLHPHGPMPAVVAQGRRPDIRACGFCHTPTGQGRPENASLAGQPSTYLAAQLRDFRDGKRHAAWPAAYGPADLMILAAQRLTDEEIESSAAYFSQQQPVIRADVHESANVPRSRVVGLVYAAEADGGTEPIGQRLLEFTPDIKRHEQRDDAMHYAVYVPPGSLKRGAVLATRGRPQESLPACASCHGADLRGLGGLPGIGGRSATYLLRSLYAFRTGTRSAPSALPMRSLSQQLSVDDLRDVAVYAASLAP